MTSSCRWRGERCTGTAARCIRPRQRPLPEGHGPSSFSCCSFAANYVCAEETVKGRRTGKKNFGTLANTDTNRNAQTLLFWGTQTHGNTSVHSSYKNTFLSRIPNSFKKEKKKRHVIDTKSKHHCHPRRREKHEMPHFRFAHFFVESLSDTSFILSAVMWTFFGSVSATCFWNKASSLASQSILLSRSALSFICTLSIFLAPVVD